MTKPSVQEAPAQPHRCAARPSTCSVGSERDVVDGLCLRRAFNGRRLRALTVVDAFTREALATDFNQGIKGEQAGAAMTRI